MTTASGSTLEVVRFLSLPSPLTPQPRSSTSSNGSAWPTSLKSTMASGTSSVAGPEYV